MWVHYPDEHFPFGFIRHNGDQYILGRFSTDGGSIPQVMQALPGMTAWHFGAAYLIHDWIWYLHQKHEASISMEESNIILCEAIKTLIEKGYLSHVEFNGDAGTVYNIWRGVQSPFARKKWREYGKRQ